MLHLWPGSVSVNSLRERMISPVSKLPYLKELLVRLLIDGLPFTSEGC